MSNQVWLFLHLLSAFMIVGGAAIGETVLGATRRTQNTRQLLALLSLGQRVPLLTMPGALLSIITGSVLTSAAGYSFGAPWISATYTAWLVAVGLSVAVLGPAERKMLALARQEVEAGVEESAALTAAVREPKVVIVTRLLSAMTLIFLVLMVFKPGE